MAVDQAVLAAIKAKFDVNGFSHQTWTGLSDELYVRWMVDSAEGTRPVSNQLNTEILEYALNRDKAINPNLSVEACPFLTPEKRAELITKYGQAHIDPPPPPPTE
jgi:hypothetical protein